MHSHKGRSGKGDLRALPALLPPPFKSCSGGGVALCTEADSHCELGLCLLKFGSASGYDIRGPFPATKCSILLMKQYFVCTTTLFLGLCCKAAGSGVDGVTQGAMYLGEVKKIWHFLVLIQNTTAGGNLT